MASIAELIKKSREKAGITQAQLADGSKLTQSYLSQVESGRKTPSIGTLRDIARVLKVHPGDLLPRR